MHQGNREDQEATLSKQTLERQEGQEWAGDKPLPDAAQVVDDSVHLLSQWAAPKAKLPCNTEKQTASCHNTLTAEGTDRTLNLPQRKGVGQRNKPSEWKSQ
jgi:hypothetical protein